MEQKEEYLGCGYAVILIILSGVAVMLMWNIGLANAFGLEPIGFWQALILDTFVSYVIPTTSIKDNGYTLTELATKLVNKATVSMIIVFIASMFL